MVGLFYCLDKMDARTEQQEAMLEFWEDLIRLGVLREDWEALRNIPTDIYMMLGYDVRSFMGMPTEDEENGYVLSEGCSWTSQKSGHS